MSTAPAGFVAANIHMEAPRIDANPARVELGHLFCKFSEKLYRQAFGRVRVSGGSDEVLRER